MIDTVVRYVPGVLGDPESLTEESHSDPGRLEYPQYTRPRVFRGMAVPEVLLSGDHRPSPAGGGNNRWPAAAAADRGRTRQSTNEKKEGEWP